MLPRSVSALISQPTTQLIKSSAPSAVNTIRNQSPVTYNAVTNTFTAPLKSRRSRLQNTNPQSQSSSSSSSNASSSSSSFKKTAALLSLPALVLATDFSEEDKENCVRSLKCSASSLKESFGLKESSSFFTPLVDYTIHDTRMCIGVSIIPHPAKVAKGGEDAYFISEDMKTIGVADGVGGWSDIGVDPALYARMLMASGKYSADSTYAVNREPVKIMSDAYEHSSEIQGSATCCIVLLDGFCLRTANLGDSGFMVIRGADIVFRSKEQQHSFNFPYQLGTGSADMPSHAISVTVNIQPGDLVIVGTDGLWDNLYDDEIVELATSASEPMTIAQLIARQAHETAASKSVISPFAKAARENGYPLATGGKMDDISVVVARVVLTSDGNLPSFAA